MERNLTPQQRTSKLISGPTVKSISASRARPPHYHLQRTIGNQAVSRLLFRSGIQPKLTVSDPGDAFEREADDVAAQVMRMPEPQSGVNVQRSQVTVQRECTKCEENQNPQRMPEAQKPLQARHADYSAASDASGLEPYLNTARGSGGALPQSARAYFEPRFGRDLSDVRVHTDGRASEAASSIAARAFTSGQDIVFGSGQYDPNSHQGKTLLAHELTHVVQQSANSGAVQRDAFDELKKAAEELAKQQLVALGNAPAGPASGFKGANKCGPKFCQPFVNKAFALTQLAWAGPLLLTGIAAKVNSRVVPFWTVYLAGGSGPLNITSTFGTDFSNSPTTATTTQFLVGELRKDIEKNPAGLPTAPGTVVKDFTPRLAAALAKIDDPKDGKQMNFNFPTDIAGNIAGGIGKDETKFPIGATPSPFNDSREATIMATLTRNVDGSLTVAPDIKFKVKDTIDLCPGDCGTPAEMVATIPLSRFEATGIAGDVPLIVEFDAPAAEQKPFTIAAPPKKPVNGKVTASSLNIRAAPNDSSSILGHYPRGTVITVLCQTKGKVIDGNDAWFKTDKGFVSARYVTVSGSAIPDKC